MNTANYYFIRIRMMKKISVYPINPHAQHLNNSALDALSLMPKYRQALILASSKTIKIFLFSVLTITLAACASTNHSSEAEPADKSASATLSAPHAQSNLDTQIVGVVTSPLTDFNLMRADISPVLIAALKGPYQLPIDKSCDAIAIEVRALDLAIGPDLDAPALPADTDLFDRGSTELSNAAVGALRRTVEGTIPFRSWIRKFSGAEKHSKEVTTAVAAGIVRRSFLKGLGQASGCLAPAAPRLSIVSNS
jgi:hypothetical protein